MSTSGRISVDSTPESALLAAARRQLVARRSSLLQLQHAVAQQLHQQRQQAEAWRMAQQQQQAAVVVATLQRGVLAPQQSLLSWSGSVLRVTCQDAYLMAQHIWDRVHSRLDGMLLVSLGAQHPSAVAMLVCLWLGAKLEDNRRSVAPASRLAKVAGMLPSGITSVELHIMQLLNWQPYKGWVRGSSTSSCTVSECA